MFELRTLGTLQIRGTDGRPVEALRRRSARLAFLAYLTADRPAGPRRRDTLLAMFWPEASPERARGALRQALQTLGDVLGANALTGRGTDSVGCNPAEVWCDARALDRASEAGRHAEVLRLFAGEFLPGVSVPGGAAPRGGASLRRPPGLVLGGRSPRGPRGAGGGHACPGAPLAIRSNFLVFAAVHPTLDPLRGHPRFAGLLERLGRR